MVEPKNPIVVIKEGKVYPAADCYKLDKPFALKVNLNSLYTRINIPINDGEKPIYFKRKQIKNSLSSKGLKQVLINIKYCIGKISIDGKKTEYWINSEGELL